MSRVTRERHVAAAVIDAAQADGNIDEDEMDALHDVSALVGNETPRLTALLVKPKTPKPATVTNQPAYDYRVESLAKDPSRIQLISDTLKQDRAFLMKAVLYNPAVFAFLDLSLRSNLDFICQVLPRNLHHQSSDRPDLRGQQAGARGTLLSRFDRALKAHPP